jgi:hypothetical protein
VQSSSAALNWPRQEVASAKQLGNKKWFLIGHSFMDYEPVFFLLHNYLLVLKADQHF